jgi:hypothetical protein
MYFLSASVLFGLLANNRIDLVNLQPVSAESHRCISDSHQIARRDQRERCGIVVHKLMCLNFVRETCSSSFMPFYVNIDAWPRIKCLEQGRLLSVSAVTTLTNFDWRGQDSKANDVQIRRDEKRTILLIRMAMYVTE